MYSLFLSEKHIFIWRVYCLKMDNTSWAYSTSIYDNYEYFKIFIPVCVSSIFQMLCMRCLCSNLQYISSIIYQDVSWYLYKNVAQNMLLTYMKENRYFPRRKKKCVSTLDLIKCLQHIH